MKTKILLKSILTGFILTSIIILQANADRVYILPGSGYNQADPAIVNAIIANGHTVVSGSASSITLPPGFTSTYIDPVNGYDWLCLFGEVNYSVSTDSTESPRRGRETEGTQKLLLFSVRNYRLI